MALRRTAWSEHGMASVNHTQPRRVNQMGKTHTEPLTARHAMCELALTVTGFAIFQHQYTYHKLKYGGQCHSSQQFKTCFWTLTRINKNYSIFMKNCHTPLSINLDFLNFTDPKLCCIDSLNHLTPNGHFSGRTAPLSYRCCIFLIYSTDIRTEYFKHAA
jgi:hypothetical protein